MAEKLDPKEVISFEDQTRFGRKNPSKKEIGTMIADLKLVLNADL